MNTNDCATCRGTGVELTIDYYGEIGPVGSIIEARLCQECSEEARKQIDVLTARVTRLSDELAATQESLRLCADEGMRPW